MAQEQLTFQEFQNRIDAAFPDSEQPPGRAEKASFVVMLAGFSLMLPAAVAGIHAPLGKLAVVLGLVLEIVSGAVYMFLSLRRNLSGLQFSEQTGANELELDFRGYQRLTAWLRTFPAEQLRSRLIFASFRIESWQRGVLLILGGIEKLGMLPIVVALYLQFRNTTWTWPPDITPVGAVLALTIVSFYALGLWATMRKLQSARFERLLKAALDPDFRPEEAPCQPAARPIAPCD